VEKITMPFKKLSGIVAAKIIYAGEGCTKNRN